MDPSTADDTQNFDHTFLDMAPVLDASSTEPIAPVDDTMLEALNGFVESTTNSDLFDCYSYNGASVGQPDCDVDSPVSSSDALPDNVPCEGLPASAVDSAAQMPCPPKHPLDVAASLSGEDEWDLVEQHGEEARNGASEATLFSRGVVDKYKLAFRNSAAPLRNGIDFRT